MGASFRILGGPAVVALTALAAPLALMTAGGADTCQGADVASAASGGRYVGASTFGGPADPGTPGSSGAGGELRGKLAFAELSTNWSASGGWDFAALGKLPMGASLRITVNGQSVIARKRDVGRGGPPVGSPPTGRRIDLWWETAQALGLPGNFSGRVQIEPEGSGPTGAVSECDGSAVGADDIVAIAQREVGTREPEAWSRYGPDPWCAYFVSWVWRKAGIEVPTTAFTGALFTWARNGGGEALPASARPQPGDAIFYGTGPSSPQTSEHVGLVERVFPDGQITTIEGNTAGGVSVARIGPFRPNRATEAPAFRPAPVYGYARPRRAR